MIPNDINIEDRESKMVDFIDEVNRTKKSEDLQNKMRNTPDYKLRLIKNEKEKAKGICLDAIFSKIYKDALPLDQSYKVAHGEDLDTEITDFINSRNNGGMEYYIKEAIKRGSIPAKRIMESVEQMVKDAFYEQEMNIKNISPKDIKFDINSDENQSRLAKISDDMQLDEISEVIKDNIRQTAQDEIQAVKDEDQRLQDLESELAADPEITSEAAIEKALRLKGYGKKKIYTPSLFNGIMINKTNIIKESMNDIDAERCGKLAFIESVKEYAKWSVIKALRLEDFTPNKVQNIANKYARN